VSVEPVNQFAKDLFYIVNEGTGTEQHRHHAVEVAAYNVMSYLWEIETKTQYAMKKKDDIFSGLGGDVSDTKVTEKGESIPDPSKEEDIAEVAAAADAGGDDAEKKKPKKEKIIDPETEKEREEKKERIRVRQAANRARNIVSSLKNVKIFPMTSVEENSVRKNLLDKAKFQGFFDHVFVSQHAVHHAGTEGFTGIVKSGGTVRLETGKHIYALQKDQLKELSSKMGEMIAVHKDWDFADQRCKGVGEKEVIDYEYCKDLETLELVKV